MGTQVIEIFPRFLINILFTGTVIRIINRYYTLIIQKYIYINASTYVHVQGVERIELIRMKRICNRCLISIRILFRIF